MAKNYKNAEDVALMQQNNGLEEKTEFRTSELDAGKAESSGVYFSGDQLAAKVWLTKYTLADDVCCEDSHGTKIPMLDLLRDLSPVVNKNLEDFTEVSSQSCSILNFMLYISSDAVSLINREEHIGSKECVLEHLIPIDNKRLMDLIYSANKAHAFPIVYVCRSNTEDVCKDDCIAQNNCAVRNTSDIGNVLHEDMSNLKEKVGYFKNGGNNVSGLDWTDVRYCMVDSRARIDTGQSYGCPQYYQDRLLMKKDVAKMLGVSTKTVETMVKEGLLTAYHFAGHRRVYFLESEVLLSKSKKK